MIKFTEYREKAKLGDLEFEVTDLKVSFFKKMEDDPTLYNDLEIIRQGSTLSEEEIQSLGSRTKADIANKILDITNPDRHNDSEDSEGKK